MYLIAILILLLAGCATDAQLPNDHVARTLTSEVRSPFGTNMGFAKLQHCEKKYLNTDKMTYEATNCSDLTGWVPMWSQGQGGQVLGPALAGAAMGAGIAVQGAASASSTVTNTITTVSKGGHH